MNKEIALDSLPAPGEPLVPLVDPDNQTLLEDEIAQRIERQQSRLTRWQLWRFGLRLRWLRWRLNRSNYNGLITERYELHKQYQKIKYMVKKHPEHKHKLQTRYELVKQSGQRLTALLDQLQPLSNEFDNINAAIRAHYELLEFEIQESEDMKKLRREARTWEQQIIATFRQSPKLHHAGYDKNNKWFCDTPIIEQILIRDDKVLYHIKTTTQNAIQRFLGRWTNALPYGVDIDDLTSDKTLSNLSGATKRTVTVERGQRGHNLFYSVSRLDATNGIPNKILYQKIIDWYPGEDHKKTPWCAGVTEDRKLEWYNFEDNPHVLIAGATKGGKSNHVNQMIATLTTMNTPAELRVMLVDLKGGIEFVHWSGLKHQIRPMATKPDQVLDALKFLTSIMEKRLEMLESVRAKNLMSYNDKVAEPLPRIVCFVDEMATLIGLGDLTSDLHTQLRVLSAQGRAVGVNLVLCTQHSSVDVLPGWVKTNMSLRISAKMPSHQASMIILDTVTAATLPNVPGRLVVSSGRFEIIAQSPFISDIQIENALKISKSFNDPDNAEFIGALPPPKPKFGRDDVLRYAMNDLKGKVSANRIHKLCGGNDIITLRNLRSIVEEIIEDGMDEDGIIYEDVRYKIKRVGRAYVMKPWDDGITEPDKSPEDTDDFIPLDVPSEETENTA